jgi:hypothetical protein
MRWPFQTNPAPIPAVITADTSSMIITVSKEWLTERSKIDPAASRILHGLIGYDAGGWDGSDYELGLDADTAIQIINVIDDAHLHL